MNFKSGQKNFGLWRALAVSLVLHAGLWSQAPLPPVVARAVSPLKATLRPSAIVPSLPSRPTPLPEAARSEALAPPAAPIPLRSPQAAPALSPDSPAASQAGIDGEGMRQYRLSLAVAARRFKHYPALALDRGLRGRAEVRVAIAANGLQAPPQLLSSSGHDLLDEAALEMIARAVQATRLPQQLQGQAFALQLPVLFEIDGE